MEELTARETPPGKMARKALCLGQPHHKSERGDVREKSSGALQVLRGGGSDVKCVRKAGLEVKRRTDNNF